MALVLDDKDVRLLEALQENARAPFSAIGRKIGLSQPATSERAKRLEDRGFITGYGARLDHGALGFAVTAMIRLRTTNAQITAALSAFEDIPEILEIYRTTGEDCLLLKLVVEKPERLEALIDRIARFGEVTTSIVLREYPSKLIGRKLLCT